MSTPEPRRPAVHFALPDSPSISIADSLEDHGSTTSSLTFLNSQIVSHGFARSPGPFVASAVEKLTLKEQEVMGKCLLGMLSQRLQDMNRTDEMTAKINTLLYEQERLQSMIKTANEATAHAEREAEAAKSKLASANLAFASLQTTQKQTMLQLQRAQGAVQQARTTAQNEVKRKEKEMEKLVDRLAKITQDRDQKSSAASMTCLNLVAESNAPAPKGEPLLEASLAQLSSDHERLMDQNESFKDVLLSLANSLQEIVHALTGDADQEYPPSMIASTFFNPSPSSPSTTAPPLSLNDPSLAPMTAHGKMKEMITIVRDRVEAGITVPLGGMRDGDDSEGAARGHRRSDEVDALLTERAKLQAELDETKKMAAEQTQRIMDDLAHEKKLARNSMSSQSAADSEREKTLEKLKKREKKLEEERQKVMEASLALGKDREKLLAEKAALAEEKRSWKMQADRGDTPPFPPPPSSTPFDMTFDTDSHRKKKSPTSGQASPKSKEKDRKSRKKVQLGGLLGSSTCLPLVEVIEEEPEFPSMEIMEPMTAQPEIPKERERNPFDIILEQSAQAAKKIPVVPPPSPSKYTAPPLASIFAPSSIPQSDSGSEPGPMVQPPQTKTPSPPTSLHSIQQALKKKYHAPAVPSPLSRILNLADSPAWHAGEDDEWEAEDVLVEATKPTEKTNDDLKGKGRALPIRAKENAPLFKSSSSRNQSAKIKPKSPARRVPGSKPAAGGHASGKASGVTSKGGSVVGGKAKALGASSSGR